MSKKKCIYKAKELDDEDRDFLISPCFQIRSDIEYKEVPTNGEEFLLKVIKERQNCPTISKCNKDYSKFAKNQSCFFQELPRPKSAPDKLKPTIEWQNIQVADFSDIRMYISRVLIKNSNNVQKLEIDHNNRASWKIFFETREPTLSCVLGLRQALLDSGFEYLMEKLGEIKPGDTIDHKTGQWIYGFLACTRQPLVSDTVSILRDLARKCADIRSYINEEDENAISAVAPLNIFICLIARYFRQYDLAD